MANKNSTIIAASGCSLSQTCARFAVCSLVRPLHPCHSCAPCACVDVRSRSRPCAYFSSQKIKLNLSLLAPHTSHLTPHTSHLTPHTSHLITHTSRSAPCSSHLIVLKFTTNVSNQKPNHELNHLSPKPPLNAQSLHPTPKRTPFLVARLQPNKHAEVNERKQHTMLFQNVSLLQRI